MPKGQSTDHRLVSRPALSIETWSQGPEVRVQGIPPLSFGRGDAPRDKVRDSAYLGIGDACYVS